MLHHQDVGEQRVGRLPNLAGLVWLAVLATAALFTCFWLAGHYRPGAVWGAITVASVLTPLMALLAAGRSQLIRGPRRPQALGWVLIGTTLLVWLTAHFTELAIKARTREPLSIGLPTRVSALWASPLFEIEARRRYPRWTHGEHVVLIDNEEKLDAESLVAAMDKHVVAMAELLGRPAPATEMAWVRGPLFGQDGRAAIMWALCGQGVADYPELTYLDDHEAAHVLITALCGPGQYPPCLLAEGWAESQSNDRDRQILHLADRRAEGTVCSLQELIGPGWYTRDDGAAYWVGGPLTHYLLERYGGPKFLELYDGVRPVTFLTDCESILGESWSEVEAAFWPWLDAQAKAILTEYERTTDAWNKLDEGVDPRDWQALLAGYRAANPRRFSLPADVAFEFTTDYAVEAAGDQPARRDKTVFHAVRRGDDFWILDTSSDYGACVYMGAAQKSAYVYQDANGPLRGWARGRDSRWEAYAQGMELLELCCHGVDADSYLPWRPESYASHLRVRSVDRPAQHDQPWRVVFADLGRGETPPSSHEATFDPRQNWQITRLRVTSDCLDYEAEASYQRLGDMVLPQSFHDRSPRSPDDPPRSVGYTLRELPPAEAQAIQRRVESAARDAPPLYGTLRRILLGAVIVWPLAGATLVIGGGRQRDDLLPLEA
jgi:hypothetical protein